MSYDIYLHDPVSGNTLELDTPHQIMSEKVIMFAVVIPYQDERRLPENIEIIQDLGYLILIRDGENRRGDAGGRHLLIRTSKKILDEWLDGRGIWIGRGPIMMEEFEYYRQPVPQQPVAVVVCKYPRFKKSRGRTSHIW